MAILSDYTTGTVSLTNGSAVVTGASTAWNITALQMGDELLVNNLVGIISSVDGPTQITLTRPWTGGTVAAQPYRARYQPDGSRLTNIAKELYQLLNSSPNFSAFAGLSGVAGGIPYFTGAGAMDLVVSGAKGRNILLSTTTIDLLGRLGPVNGGKPSKLPSGSDVGMADGDFNTLTIPGTYAIYGNWTNGYLGAAANSYNGILEITSQDNSVIYQNFMLASLTNPINMLRTSGNSGSSWGNWLNITHPSLVSTPVLNNNAFPDRLRENNNAVDIGNCNNAVNNGFYRINVGTSNSPFNALGSLIVSSRAPNYITQIATRNDNAQTFIRVMNNGVWTGWAHWAIASEKKSIEAVGGSETDIGTGGDEKIGVNFVATTQKLYALGRFVVLPTLSGPLDVYFNIELRDVTAGGALVKQSQSGASLMAGMNGLSNSGFQCAAMTYDTLTLGNTYRISLWMWKNAPIGPIIPRYIRIEGMLY